MADDGPLRLKRHKLHIRGDHSLCHDERCPVLRAQKANPLLEAIRTEFPDDDPVVKALALSLVDKASGEGSAAVQAIRALGELVAEQRRR